MAWYIICLYKKNIVWYIVFKLISIYNCELEPDSAALMKNVTTHAAMEVCYWMKALDDGSQTHILTWMSLLCQNFHSNSLEMLMFLGSKIIWNRANSLKITS